MFLETVAAAQVTNSTDNVIAIWAVSIIASIVTILIVYFSAQKLHDAINKWQAKSGERDAENLGKDAVEGVKEGAAIKKGLQGAT